ncbi:MAG: glycosyltransferase family 2 protein [Eubacterium sp.]|nr:glycosyltransferase family 2 protein [Eubacterium sp.]
MIKLTIVMPCYNEGTRIYRNIIETITQVEKFCESFRVIAVNDGSTDETESEIRRAAQADKRVGVISYPENKGKGYAVRRGMLAAKSEYVAFLDADLEIPPYLLKGFLEKADGIKGDENPADESAYDIVIGSKMHPDSQVEYPFLRKVFSMGYYIFMKVLFSLKVKDTQTGIKLFRLAAIQPILRNMKTTGFSFDIEMLAIASKLGLDICEMPVVVNFSRNKGDKSKISMKSIYDMVRDSLRIKVYVSKLKF